MPNLPAGAWASATAVLIACVLVGASDAASAEPSAPSPEARAVFDHAKDKLVQLRVIHKATRTRSSTGTGFVATADGLVLTNYHVVSKLALEPNAYELELERSDGSSGPLRLLAVDVANDLAVLSTGRRGQPFLPILEAPLNKGERGFAMGHPLDLGLTIVEGTYNGFIETDFVRRIHYTGAVNPGMSGGPALTSDGRVFGINVAVRRDGQLVSYLVPSEHAAALLRRAATQDGPADFRKEVAAQLLAHQERLLAQLLASPMPTTTLSQYTVPDAKVPFVRCWALPYDQPKRLYDWDTRTCSSNSGLFVDDRLRSGHLQFTHDRYETRELGALRFAARIERAYDADSLPIIALWPNKKELTEFRCHDDFVSRPAGTLRVAVCTRAYKSFEGLYDFHLRALTVDSSSSALLSTLTLAGVSFETGQRFARQYLEAISWTK